MEVLVSAMNIENIRGFVTNMNLKTDAIIVNQTDQNSYSEMIINNKKIKVYNFNEKGVGLSRNTALMRANSDIVLMSDEDMIYEDDYEEKILEAFRTNPKADTIIFNIKSANKNRPSPQIKRNKRINKFNYLKYGAPRIAIKTDSLKKKNVYFSLLFGGGTKYQSGEDSIFIRQCLEKKMKIYTSIELIGTVKQEDSSWFKGYNEKFFIDKGALFANLFPTFTSIYFLQFLLRHKYMLKQIKFARAYKLMSKGKKEFLGAKK